MTSKDFALSRYPNMKSERHKTGFKGRDVYYLIRDGRNTIYFSEGKNESKAWVSAKEKEKEKDND
jgi:hypothetical protein